MDGLCINGQVYYVSDMKDFIDLVRDVMGDDSAKWLEGHLEDIDDGKAELLTIIDDAVAYLHEAMDALSAV